MLHRWSGLDDLVVTVPVSKRTRPELARLVGLLVDTLPLRLACTPDTGFDTLLAGRSAIIIAHRLSTVQRADTILMLENGRMREYGPRTQLARDPLSHFARLLHTAYEEVLQ